MRKILLPPVLLLLCIGGMFAAHRMGWVEPRLPAIFDYIGYALVIAGIALPVWSAQIFKRVETNIIPYKSPDKIVTEGPFRFSRNPMYLGMLTVLIGVAGILGAAENYAFALLYFAVANWWYIPFEEMKMHKVFGDAFDDYRTRVRRWL